MLTNHCQPPPTPYFLSLPHGCHVGIEVQLSTGVHRHRDGAVLDSLPRRGGGLCMSLDLTGESVRTQLPMWGEWGGGGRSAPYSALLKPRGGRNAVFLFQFPRGRQYCERGFLLIGYYFPTLLARENRLFLDFFGVCG